MRLADKIALVTGSSSGIGQGIALRFAREGADVVINYHSSKEEAQETLRQVEAMGRRGLVLQADVGQVADVFSLVDQTVAHFGRIDILVANAGVEKQVPALDVTEELWDWVLNVNLKSAFFAAQRAARNMQQRGGRIIFMSSVHEDMAFPGHSPYCASKGGLRMLMRNLAVELAPHGITVNNIAPGAIQTAINKAMLADQERTARLLANIPLDRLGTVNDVAAVALFLASDEAAYVTGSTYYVDGGLSRHYKE